MSRLDREPRKHIHEKLVDECNDMSIRIKANFIIKDAPEKLKAMNPAPTWEEVEKLIWRCVDEMNRCTESYRKF